MKPEVEIPGFVFADEFLAVAVPVMIVVITVCAIVWIMEGRKDGR